MEKSVSFRLGLFRVRSFLQHYLTAWHTGGEGIHSPYLFDWVRMWMYDDNAYYVWSHIEKERNRLLRDTRTLLVTDYGTGSQRNPQRKVADIAASSLQSSKYARLLFRLVCFLGENRLQANNAFDGLSVVELGTSLGITTAYLAATDSRNTVYTYEGSSALLEQAGQVWKRLNFTNIRSIVGNIDDTLGGTLPEKIDLAYIDANHRCEAVMRYFAQLLPHVHRKTVFVIDDIHYSPDMLRVWQTICRHPMVTTTMNLYDLGLVFFDTDYLHKNYRLRY